MTEFSIQLLQAINDWQIGGTPPVKKRRGTKLKLLSAHLDERFRRTSLCCFRRLALSPAAVWQLHDQLHLKETISAWTLSLDVAKSIKDGVPPDGVPGLILDIAPPSGSVVVNLDALYRDAAFNEAREWARDKIRSYDRGMARYENSQHEVVLDLESVAITAVYALGGHSSNEEDLADLYFGRAPTVAERQEFRSLLNISSSKIGPNWLVGAAKDRVLTKTLTAHGVIKRRRSATVEASGVTTVSSVGNLQSQSTSND